MFWMFILGLLIGAPIGALIMALICYGNRDE